MIWYNRWLSWDINHNLRIFLKKTSLLRKQEKEDLTHTSEKCCARTYFEQERTFEYNLYCDLWHLSYEFIRQNLWTNVTMFLPIDFVENCLKIHKSRGLWSFGQSCSFFIPSLSNIDWQVKLVIFLPPSDHRPSVKSLKSTVDIIGQ